MVKRAKLAGDAEIECTTSESGDAFSESDSGDNTRLNFKDVGTMISPIRCGSFRKNLINETPDSLVVLPSIGIIPSFIINYTNIRNYRFVLFHLFLNFL